MKKDIIDRVIKEAEYIVSTEQTIREIAKKNGISKSTVHKDLHERLEEIDKDLFIKVSKILEKHLQIRHIRGGESTRQKYLKLKECL